MIIDVATKFNVGDTGYIDFLDQYVPIDITGIEVLVDDKYNIIIQYSFKPYSDKSITETIREDLVFHEEEIEKSKY